MIWKEMTILDILCDHQEAQEVFRGYDQVVGECVMCNHLFGGTSAHAALRIWADLCP